MAIYKFCGFLNTVRHIAHKMMFWKDAERVYAFFISKNDPNETLMYRFTLMRLKTFYSEAMCKIQGNIQYCGIIREYHLIKSFRLTDKGKIMFLPIDKGYITDEVKGGYIILAKDKASFKRALLNYIHFASQDKSMYISQRRKHSKDAISFLNQIRKKLIDILASIE